MSQSRRWIVRPAAEHQKEVIGLIVLVPHERPLHLDCLELVVVEETDDARLVGLLEQRQLRSKVDLVVHSPDVYQQTGMHGAAGPNVRWSFPFCGATDALSGRSRGVRWSFPCGHVFGALERTAAW
jgi:hypothetical protein